ncbi:hypothetical protein EES43_28275 [Streptomyces sp. ADI96-02]|nr:hypothetical protein EES43_28275 [Streptomyces sp. ADI96-02]
MRKRPVAGSLGETVPSSEERGVVMSGSQEPADLARQMRDKAQQLAEAAERATDPQERQRLEKKSRTIRDRSEQQSAMASGDIYPEK